MPLKSLSKTHHFSSYLNLHNQHLLNEGSALYLTHTIRMFALSLIGIFLPIYIYGLSQDHLIFSSDPVRNGIIWVISYFFVTSIFSVLFLYFGSGYVFQKLKFRGSILVSFVLLGIMVWLWDSAESNIYILYLAAFFTASQVVFYWLPYHISFTRKIKDNHHHYGKKLGYRLFLVKITGGIAPLVGGLIIATTGYNSLFMLCILLLLIGGLPVFLMTSEHQHSHHDPKKVIKKYFLNKKYRHTSATFIGMAFEDLVYVCAWTILMFLILESFVKVGFITSLSGIISAVAVLWVGAFIDRHGTRRAHLIGVLCNSAMHFLRIFVSSALAVYVIDIVDRFNSNLFVTPRGAKIYEISKEEGESDFMLYRELVLHSSFVVASIIAALIVAYVPYWRSVFVFAIFGSLLTYSVHAKGLFYKASSEK